MNEHERRAQKPFSLEGIKIDATDRGRNRLAHSLSRIRIKTMSTLSRSFVIATAAAAALAATALPAAAQTYSYGQSYSQSSTYVQGYGGQTYSNGSYGQPSYAPQGYYQDQRDYRDSRCDRERQGRTGAGALIGGGLGAVVGSNVATGGGRTGGAIIGGLLGAVAGGNVGRSSSDACYDQQRYNGSYSYGQPGYSQGYSQPSANVYYDQNGYGPYAADDRRYENQRYDDRRDDRRYDDRDDRRQVSPDGRYVYDPNHGWIPR
jgi:hypothetical protein